MKKTFKQIFTDYINALCDELRASIEHNKNKPRTPKLHKLGRLAIILCFVIYLLIGCFGIIKSNAAEPLISPSLRITSEGGLVAPTDLTGYTVTVPSGWTATAGYGSFSLNGHIVSPEAYVDTLGPFAIGYTLDPMSFLLEPYANSIVLNTYPIFVYPDSSFSILVTGGDDSSNPDLIQWLVDNGATFTRSAPSNLSGYSVTLLENWSAPSSTFLSAFYLTEPVFTVSPMPDDLYGEYFALAVGYQSDPPGTPIPNSGYVSFGSEGGVYTSSFSPSTGFTINFLNNPDASSLYTDFSLINWFVSNGATFTYTGVPDDPDPEPEPTVTLPSGIYYASFAQSAEPGVISFNTPFISKSAYFGSIEFNDVDGGVDINYVDADDDITNVYYPGEGWRFNEYSVIYLQNDEVLTESEWLLFDSVFLSFADYPDLEILFNAGQENGQSVGYSQGYNVGRTEGYSEGFAAGRAEGQAEGFMSSFFGGIVQALDALKLFGDISLLNIIEAVLGLMLALFILKLIAGG